MSHKKERDHWSPGIIQVVNFCQSVKGRVSRVRWFKQLNCYCLFLSFYKPLNSLFDGLFVVCCSISIFSQYSSFSSVSSLVQQSPRLRLVMLSTVSHFYCILIRNVEMQAGLCALRLRFLLFTLAFNDITPRLRIFSTSFFQAHIYRFSNFIFRGRMVLQMPSPFSCCIYHLLFCHSDLQARLRVPPSVIF